MSRRTPSGWNLFSWVGSLSAIALAFAAGPSFAVELPFDGIALDGFGTLGATYHNDRGLEFRRTIGQGTGTSAGKVSFDTDSVFGLQLDVPIGREIDIVAQSITQENADRTWTPQAARAFVRYEPDPDLMLRGGRIGYDVILHADSPYVGYSFLPIRPALEFFGLLPSDILDGADATLTGPGAAGLFRVRAFIGRSPGEVANADRSVTKLDELIRGAFLDYVRGDWTARVAAAYVTMNTPAGAGVLADALLATGVPTVTPTAESLARPGMELTPVLVGLDYDGSPWEFQLQYTHVSSNSTLFGVSDSGLLLLGYHRGALTPYASFSGAQASGAILPSGLPPLAVFAPLDAAVSAVQTSGRTTQRTLSLGIRYDFAPHMDLKLQVDHLWLHQSEIIWDLAVPPLSRPTMTLCGLALDFVF